MPQNGLEWAMLSAAIGLGFLYIAFIRIPKTSKINNDVQSLIMPILIAGKSWNIEYEVHDKPMVKEFMKSRLFPFPVEKIEGLHFFSGIAIKLPFIAWHADVSYREIVGESALSQRSSTASINGFSGFQVMVKNIMQVRFPYIVVQKTEDEDLQNLFRFYHESDKWQIVKTSDGSIQKDFVIFSSKKNVHNEIPPSLITKLSLIKQKCNWPFSISIRAQEIFMNLYLNDPFAELDSKKTLEKNLEHIEKELEMLVISSFELAKP
jgi:hypothetical protein